jgi:diguanylate cyclase (GGDEF)-like protein
LPIEMKELDPTGDAAASVFSLTQIRHLMRVEFGRAQRYGYPLSCIVVGVDRLDRIRDVHGYEACAAVLEQVVGLLQAATRTCDYLGRLRDDRLLAILPHTSSEGGAATARRLLAEARGLALPLRSGTEPQSVRLSIGISHYERENTLFFDSLVEAAEAAMEEAARAGGDRCVHRDPGPAAVRGAGEERGPRGR